MTETQLTNPDRATPDMLRPSISFESITFSDGQTLSFDDEEIVVFVGPNNAGKSAALRELQNCIARSQTQTVITGTNLKKTGTGSDLVIYLEKNSQKIGDQANLTYAGFGYQIHHSHTSWFDAPVDRNPVAPFFSGRLATEDRITGSNPAPAIALFQGPAVHPIHQLLMDQKLAATISNLFRRAFGKDLIVFRAGGSNFPLFVGDKPAKSPGKDELSESFVRQLQTTAIPLASQGDGMRSFATVLLHVLAADNHSVQFLDEPEAFLHPPQARLIGEYIAKERRAKSQLFVATHSTDVLNGLMVGGTSKIRIIRIQRDGAVNRVKELSREKTASIRNDTLTRFSGVFEGIFFKHVIIAESDGDCLFYSSLLNTRSIAGDEHPDVKFIHASGKHRMAKLASTLKSLDVPVSVIADIDILSEEAAFRNLFETLGGTWSEVEGHWQAIKNGVQSSRPSLTGEQVKGMILNELNSVSGMDEFPKNSKQKIKNIFDNLSPWQVIKQAGRSGFKGPQMVQNFDQLESKCSEYGLWIVPVGELEGFCRSVEPGHGPAFVEKVLEERDLENDVELQDARAFVAKIWTAAKGH